MFPYSRDESDGETFSGPNGSNPEGSGPGEFTGFPGREGEQRNPNPQDQAGGPACRDEFCGKPQDGSQQPKGGRPPGQDGRLQPGMGGGEKRDVGEGEREDRGDPRDGGQGRREGERGRRSPREISDDVTRAVRTSDFQEVSDVLRSSKDVRALARGFTFAPEKRTEFLMKTIERESDGDVVAMKSVASAVLDTQEYNKFARILVESVFPEGKQESIRPMLKVKHNAFGPFSPI